MKKTMNIWSLVLLPFVAGFTSCSNSFDPEADGNYRLRGQKPARIIKTLTVNFGGDYLIESEEPLLRAEDGDTYAAINVFRTEKGVAGAEEEKYAYGLFKGKDGIEVDVVTGYTYRIESTILTERDDKVWINKDYSQPFQTQYSQNLTGTPGDYAADQLDNFQYTTHDAEGEEVEDGKRRYFHRLAYGTAKVDAGADFGPRYGDLSYPRVKRYYGVTSTPFDPEAFDDVEVEMQAKSFGLKVEVASLPAGSLTIKDVTMEGVRQKEEKEKLVFPKGLTLTMANPEWECIYSMNDLLAESEKFNLQFTWDKGAGEKETFEREVTVHPNKKRVLTVSISGEPNQQSKGNIIFTLGSVDLTDMEEEGQSISNEE